MNNLIIEIIDGVAYVLVEDFESGDGCDRCALCEDVDRCSFSRMCGVSGEYYRHLTADERVAVQEALGRGME